MNYHNTIAYYFSITMPQARGDVLQPSRFFNKFDPYDLSSQIHSTQHIRNTHDMLKDYTVSNDVVIGEQQMPSAICKIYQVIMKNSDEIDKETAEDIVNFIHFKIVQRNKKT